MTMVVKSLGDFINLIVQTFNLSTLFPALVFLILLQMFVLPLLPADSPLQIIAIVERATTGLQWVKIVDEAVFRLFANILLIVLLAYLLDATNLKIIRFFEGYPLLRFFPFDQWQQQHRSFVEETLEQVAKLKKDAEETQEQVARLEKDAQEQDSKRGEELRECARKLQDYADELLDQIIDKYPTSSDAVLPTPFGNVIAAAEDYPYKVLGMDAVVLWPFLRPILTEKGYAQFVIRDKAVMDFLLNLIVALTSFGFAFGIANWFYYGLTGQLLLNLFLIGASCYLVYLLSIQAAAGWGVTIRTSFVLYREDLRQRLRLRFAGSYQQERELWKKASAFFGGNLLEKEQAEIGSEIFSYKVT